MNPRLRPATAADKSFLKNLQDEVYKEAVIEQFGLWDERLEQQKFETKWKSNQYQVVECDGQKVGVVWITKEPDHFWLREIQISPGQQNLGIGSTLMARLIDEAIRLDLPIRLRVLKANRAVALYERLGFRKTGEFQDTHFWMDFTP